MCFWPSIRNSPSHWTSRLVLLPDQVERLLQVRDLDVDLLPAPEYQHVGHQQDASTAIGNRRPPERSRRADRPPGTGSSNVIGTKLPSAMRSPDWRTARSAGARFREPLCSLPANSTRRRGSGRRGCATRRRRAVRPPAPRRSPGRSRCGWPGRPGTPRRRRSRGRSASAAVAAAGSRRAGVPGNVTVSDSVGVGLTASGWSTCQARLRACWASRCRGATASTSSAWRSISFQSDAAAASCNRGQAALKRSSRTFICSS